MGNGRLKRFLVDDRVLTPTGMTGRVLNPDAAGRVIVRYDRRPDWQPPAAGRADASSEGASEVTLKPDLLVRI